MYEISFLVLCTLDGVHASFTHTTLATTNLTLIIQDTIIVIVNMIVYALCFTHIIIIYADAQYLHACMQDTSCMYIH